MPHPILAHAAHTLAARDALTEAKETLSSWDKCMDKNYCKWPVIVAIIVGSLIILSVVMCIARCLCCGAECACCCFRCCVGCCGSGRKSKPQKQVSPASPYHAGAPAAQGYAIPAAMPPSDPGRTYESRPLNAQQYRSHAAPTFSAPAEPIQYARFESTAKPVNEDALPSMPTWSEATKTHVVEEVIPEKRPGDVEMHRLDTTGAAAARRSPNMRSPNSQHQLSPQRPHNDAYGFPAGYQSDSYGSNSNVGGAYNGHYAQQEQGGYRGMSPVHAQQSQHSLSPVYGAAYSSPQRQPSHYDQQSHPVTYDDHHAYSTPAPAPSYSPISQPSYYDRPAPTPSPSNMGCAPSGSTRFEAPPTSTSVPAYPGQQTYQAFSPGGGQAQGQVDRKPVEGSWREV